MGKKKRSPFFRYVVTQTWGDVPFRVGQVLVELQDRGDKIHETYSPMIGEFLEHRGVSFKVNMRSRYPTGGFEAVRVKKERITNGS